MRYIDAEKLIKAIEEKGLDCSFALKMERLDTLALIDFLQQEQIDMGEVSDGYHTFNELYYYRMLYNAAFFNLLPKGWVHKSKRHHTGEECFGGGWFIVMANLPTGQVSNHYELNDWDLFKVPEKEFADEWDGHTPQEAAERLKRYLQQEQPSLPSNLDEAAEESAESWRKNPDGSESREIFFQPHIRGFKAGAEWMAGQGESHETEIVSRVTGNGLLPAVTCLVNKSYKEGDKVVVQIRKK